MIKNVKVTNEFGESITITLADTQPRTGLFITEIEGLGPPKADVIMKSIAILTGGGPAPGMNTVVASVAKTFLRDGYRVIGLHGGYSALFTDKPRMQDIDFLLADEPVSHLDDRNADIMSMLIQEEARSQGAGVIVTSIGKHMNMSYDKTYRL